MDQSMSLNLHSLDAPLDKVEENIGENSEEHGKQFPRDIPDFEFQ